MTARDQVVRVLRAGGHVARLGAVLPLATGVRLYGDTDKGRHGYVPGYVDHLGPRRWRIQRLLEIGVGGYSSRHPGGSLRVWRDYLPRATIVGLDISDKDVRLGPRVRFVQGDQCDPATLDRAVAALGGPPDVVIDDGSHLDDHAAVSFRHLFPNMATGALYVIEDLHTSYWPHYGGGWPAPDESAIGLIRSLTDDVQAADPVFAWLPELPRPVGDRFAVAAVDIRPGIAFVTRG